MKRKINKKKVNMLIKIGIISIAIIGIASNVFATDTNEPIKVINNLSVFMFGLIKAIGVILLGWGITQIGLAMKSHDPSQRANGFMTLAGGVVITFTKEILDFITGG